MISLLSLAVVLMVGLAPSTLATDSCISDNEDCGYNNCGTWRFNGGCQEHFDSLIFQDNTGSMSFTDCCTKCKEMNNCKSFYFGKRGVVRQQWCNIYKVVCTDNGDLDWNMFTPDRQTGSDWTDYPVSLQFNGGCQEHFRSLIFQDTGIYSGGITFAQCYKECEQRANCKSFTFGRQGVDRQNWCNIYSVECSNNGDTDWNMFYLVESNANAMCQAQTTTPSSIWTATISLSSSSWILFFAAMLALLLIINICSMCYINCNRQKKKNSYYSKVKRVDSEFDDSEADLINVAM